MKKIYQTPNTIVVTIQTKKIMAGSDLNYYDEPYTTETSGNLSRRGHSVWDDDDDDFDY